MKRVLIILANYSPNSSSVANCMRPLVKKMSEKYRVDIITDRKRVDIPECEVNDNVNIYRVDDYRTMNTIYLNELNKINSSHSLRIITKIFAWILKTLYYLRYVFIAREKGTGGWEVKRVYEKFRELNENEIYSYDFVISASQPFQSHYVAEKIKEEKGENIKWIVFEFDPFAFNTSIKMNSRLRKKMYADEKRIFENCDIICLTPELYEFYKKKKFIQFSSKVNLIPFANIEPVEYDSNKVSGNFMKRHKINCLFTGRLYDDIRNPSRLINVFSKIDKNIHLSMMTNLSIEKIKKYSPNNYLPSIIPFQNRDTALFNLMHADILVNIGNTVEFQVPGKIFEYMSTGKPVIHFSKIKNDPALKYLNRYPKVFIVNEWEIDNINYKNELENFCKDHKNHKLTFEDVNETLGEYSGNAVANKFINILNELAGDRLINE